MSGSMTPPGDAYLRVRYGPAYGTAQDRVAGSTVAVYVDAVERLTGQIAPIENGVLAAGYRLPHQADFPKRDWPVIPSQLAPGQWRVDVPTVMGGTFEGWLVLIADGWLIQNQTFQFDVGGGL
ncbi:hypothetical protein HMPREF9946_02241 [Acetobacteraceae bacterium AT-5844]|nr:hypothetical protein HMPREF9946_02241 [Acetobacteraceae bacterium AT-5844]